MITIPCGMLKLFTIKLGLGQTFEAGIAGWRHRSSSSSVLTRSAKHRWIATSLPGCLATNDDPLIQFKLRKPWHLLDEVAYNSGGFIIVT